jgi:hypothetical protein
LAVNAQAPQGGAGRGDIAAPGTRADATMTTTAFEDGGVIPDKAIQVLA